MYNKYIYTYTYCRYRRLCINQWVFDKIYNAWTFRHFKHCCCCVFVVLCSPSYPFSIFSRFNFLSILRIMIFCVCHFFHFVFIFLLNTTFCACGGRIKRNFWRISEYKIRAQTVKRKKQMEKKKNRCDEICTKSPSTTKHIVCAIIQNTS